MEAFISQTKVSYEFPSEIVYEHKFDTAVRNTFAARFEERYSHQKLSLLDTVMLNLIPKHMIHDKWRKDTTFSGETFRKLLSYGYRSNDHNHQRALLTKIVTSLRQVLEIQWMNMLKNYTVSNRNILMTKLRTCLDSLTIPKEVQDLFSFAGWMSQVIDNSARLRRKQGKISDEDHIKYLKEHARYEYAPLHLTIIVGDGICCYILGTKIWCIPNASLLMIHNKVCDQISVLLFATFSSGNSLPVNSYQTTLDFIRELALLHIQHSDQYFDIAKSLEALCIAESLIEHEEWENKEFLITTSNDLYASTNYDYMGSELRGLIKNSPTQLRHELCCLGKIIGHPYVDMEAGAQALYDKTHETYELNLTLVNKCIGHIKANYIRNHIVKHRKWPPCHLTYGAPMTLTQAFVRGKDPWDSKLASKYGPVCVDDMIYVNLDVNEKFHKLENIIPYLKDKTITVLRSKVLKDLLKDEDYTTPKWEETRLILAYLLNPKIIHDHIEYIDRYEDSQDLEDMLSYLVIRIVPKEKELKIKFRGFGCKTYEDRFRALAQEKNAMRFLDTYSDEQAMTLSELEILRRLLTFRSLHKAYPGYKVIYINIDASSWNNHFRKETVDDVMKETLDKIFNTTIYGKTHLAFNKTLVYVPGYPTNYAWDGQAGGIEGLNQDTWVIVYLGQIKTALEGLNVKYHVLCKGDDLRVAVAVPPAVWKNRPLSAVKNDIVQRLSLAMHHFGHEIKVLESYGSSQYFAFSKSASIGMVELPQGYRKIQKCYGSNNALLATLDEYIGSTFSNAHSACKVEPNVMPSYIVGCIWALSYLSTHPVYESCTADELTALLLVPSLAGGFPIIYLHNMPIRAESDLLSPFLKLYTTAAKHSPVVAKCMQNMMQAPYYTPGDRMTMLYKDPYSIPHSRPRLPAAILRAAIKPVLKKYVKHEDVKELMEACDSDLMEGFHQTFQSINVLNAKILSVLYSATPEGILDELIRKFESARSINELMVRTLGTNRSVKILRRVVRAEFKLQKWRVSQLKGKNTPGPCEYSLYITSCPAGSAERIRKILWGREVCGITMPPMQHQIQVITAFTHIDNDWVNNNHFTYTISNPDQSINNHVNDHYTTGPYKPFIGYTTRNGMVEPAVHFVEKDPMLTKIKNLLDLVTWTNTSKISTSGELIESNCPELISYILKTVTDTPLERLAPFSGTRRSGTIQHHVRAPSFRESIVPNTLSNIYTRVLGESNTHLRYRTSPHHYFVNFLHIYCYSIWACFWELEFDRYTTCPEKVWTVTVPCEFCNRPIEELPLTFNLSYLVGTNLHPLAISSLGNIAEQILRQSVIELDADRLSIDRRRVEDLPYDAAYTGILQEILEQTYYTRSRLMSRYNVPTMTDESYSVLVDLLPKNKGRDVGQSELKRIPLDDLADYLACTILRYMGQLCPKSIQETADGMMSSTPAEDLPWFGLIAQIHKCGRLPKLILLFNNTIGSAFPSCYYSVVSATRYLGRCAPYLTKVLRLTRPLVILSYYTPTQLSASIELILFSELNNVLQKKIVHYMPKRNIHVDQCDENSKRDLTSLFLEAIVFLAVIYHLDTICEDIAERLLRTRSEDLMGVGVSELTDVMITDMRDDVDGYSLTIAHHLHRWEAMGILMNSIDEDMAWEPVIDKCSAYTDHIRHKIHYTNIGHCCLKVRSHEAESESDAESLPEKTYVQEPDDPSLIQDLSLCKPFVAFKSYDHTASVYEDPLPELCLTMEERALPIHELFCIKGGGSGSETNLISMLKEMDKLSITNQPSTRATCFADGFGGFSSVLASHYQDSLIIYHTLVEDPHSPTLPVSLLSLRLNNVVLTDHLDEGHDDLTRWSTFLRMMQYGYLCDIVTSDLELGTDNLHLNELIQRHILLYYLQRRTRDCCLIIKLSTDDPTVIEKVLGVLMHFTTTSGIHSPRSNDSAKYLYIVARGWRKALDIQMFGQIWENGHNPHVRPGLLKYFKQVKAQRRRFLTLFKTGFDLWGIDPGVFSEVTKIRVLGVPDRLPSLLQNTFNVLIVVEKSESLPGSMEWPDRLLKLYDIDEDSGVEGILGLNLGYHIKTLWRELRELPVDEVASRRHSIICQICTAAATRYLMSIYVHRDVPLMISLDELTEVYGVIRSNLDERHRRNWVDTNRWWMPDWEHEGVIIRYNSSFRQGVKIGFVFLGTLSINNKVNATQIQRFIEHKRQ